MFLASVRRGSDELPAVVVPRRGVALVRDLLPDPAGTVQALLQDGPRAQVAEALGTVDASVFVPVAETEFAPPYRHPRMIWGIGLNYVEHAGDLSELVPEEPASFIKADHTVIGPGDEIPIPPQSNRTTAEAELGLVIGRHCRNVEPDQALSYVAGACPVLDQTAEDILERNPRYLTRAKNFPGFFSFGPWIVPLEEAVRETGSLEDIEVSTVINGRAHRVNTVSHMRYDPAFLVSFHSKVMPLQPGDIISTGTPGAVRVSAGDVVECRIPGVGHLMNPVVAGQ